MSQGSALGALLGMGLPKPKPDVTLDVKTGKVLKGDFAKWEADRKHRLAESKRFATAVNPHTGEKVKFEIAGKAPTTKELDDIFATFDAEESAFQQAEANPTPPIGGSGAGMLAADLANRHTVALAGALKRFTGAGTEAIKGVFGGDADPTEFLAGKDVADQMRRERQESSVGLEDLAAGLVTLPAHVGADLAVVTDPSSTLEQRGRGVLNLLGTVIGPAEALAILRGGKGLTKTAYGALQKKFGTKAANDVNRALKQQGPIPGASPAGPPPRGAKAETPTTGAVVGYRNNSRGGVTPGTGTFYSEHPSIAKEYQKIKGGGDLVKETLEFKNPLTIEGNQPDIVKNLDSLPFSDAAKKRIRAAWDATDGEKGYALFDTAIARAAKEAGYDGIIYDSGRAGREFVDLRPTTPPPKTPKPPVEPTPGASAEGQGIRHEDIDQLRSDMGWEMSARDKKPDDDLFKEAKKLKGREVTVAEKVIGDIKGKATLSDAEGIALGNRLRELKKEMADAKAANDGDTWDLANLEAQRIADALDESGSRQGRSFRARRFISRDFGSWEFNRGVEKAALGEPLAPKKQGYRDRVAAEVDATTASLKAERDKAVKDYELLLGATKEKRSKGAMGTDKRRAEALRTLRKLGVPVADEGAAGQATRIVQEAAGSKKAGVSFFGAKSKEGGIPSFVEEDVARAVRSLVRTYGETGAKNWGEVLSRLQKDLPGIGEEQALFILSGKYKVAKLEADLARKKAYEFMRDVQRDAEYRLKPLASKAAGFAVDLLNTTQRSLQTTLDNSMALIQGRNVLTWRPGTWFKAVGTSMRAFVTKSPIEFARKETAHIENHPLYAKAVQAKLALSDIDGPFSKQEEIFAGRLENHTPGLANSKAAATVLMNKMRFDLFRKLATKAPKDAPAEFYEDIARQINVATGKGTGRVADSLGSVQAGLVSYAPRYYLSKWQHSTFNAVRHAKTKQGRIEAMKMYGSQIVGYGMLAGAAELFGFEVDYDPRSATFGQARAADGSYTIDLFHQVSEPVRVGTQLVYGRTSRKGNYSEPGDYGSYGLGDYIESKLSPWLRTFEMARKGMTYDSDIGKRRAVKSSDFWEAYIPLSIKEMARLGWKPGTSVASFFGGNLDKPTDRSEAKNPPPPMKLWPPPGLEQMKKGDSSRT